MNIVPQILGSDGTFWNRKIILNPGVLATFFEVILE
jgi:hypothetical protein